MALITSTTEGRTPAAGQTTYDLASGYGVSNKYTVSGEGSGDTAAIVFPGLLIGRDTTLSTYTVANSLNQITSPTILNILGAVGYNTFAQSTSPAIGTSYGDMEAVGIIPAGAMFNLINDGPGFVWLWCGSTIPTGANGALYAYAGEKFTDNAGNVIYSGTIVSAAWLASNSGALVIALAGYVSLNPEFNGQVFGYGKLAPFALKFINR
jgi:hypothetical protein